MPQGEPAGTETLKKDMTMDVAREIDNQDWEKVDEALVPGLLEEINPHIEPVPFNAETTTIRERDLPFYKDYRLYELTDLSSMPGMRKYALYKQGDAMVLNWTNEPIYELNEKAPVEITPETVIPYIKFFFRFVRGRHGRFIIVESVDDIRWREELPAAARKKMSNLVVPVEIKNVAADGSIAMIAQMVFKDSLFRTSVHVQKDGLVSLSDEELMVEGMPIIQDQPE